jgi:hypothetical protein
MIRTQIQLTEDQAARLKAAAARRGISMAEVIRQAVDSAVSRTDDGDPGARYERARQIAGKFRSGTSDVSSHHDDYLAGSYAP